MAKGKHIKNESERLLLFLSYIRIDKKSGCWIWTGDKMRNGYGRIEINKRKVGTHRFSFTHFVRPIALGMEVAHRCDNRLCCNPDHLWEATHAENMADMKRKGRARNQFTGKLEQEKVLTKPGPKPVHPRVRFENSIDKNGPLVEGMNEACWEWNSTYQNGYPVFGVTPEKTVKAHHYSYNSANPHKPLQKNERLTKVCKNKRCVNPEHLIPAKEITK